MSHKVNKALLVEFALFMFVVTIVSVMAKKMSVISNPSGHRKSSPTKIKSTK